MPLPMAEVAINLSPAVPVSLTLTPGSPIIDVSLSTPQLDLTVVKSGQPLTLAPATPALVLALSSVLRGVPGPKGDTGPPATGADAGVGVAGVNMLAGTPAFVSRSNGLLYPARADTFSSSFVLGLISGDVLSGFPVHLVTGAVTLPDWTSLTGAANLLPGQVYFLSALGGLTLQVPTRPSCSASARVGVAISATVFNMQPTAPLQL